MIMKNVNNLFNSFRYNEGAIWLENEKINLSVPQKFQNQATKDFIKNNKSQIVAILKENQIFSIEQFLNTEILKDRTISQYPLSPAQERLWFIEQYEEGTNAYHIPEVFELNASTDPKGIKYALQKIVSRHEILRSTIEQGNDQEQAIQKVHDEPLIFEERVVTAEEDYEAVIKDDINRPFNLSVEYPIRVKFYRVQSSSSTVKGRKNKILLLINIHHIASDGWSMSIFQKELFDYYKAFVKNDTDFSLPELAIQYKDYALWQSVFLTGDKLKKQLTYWKEKLSDYQTLKLPTDYTRPSKVDYRGDCFYFELDQALSTKLRTLAKDKGCTLYTLLLAGFYILLHKYAQQEDIVIGTPIANRHYRQTSNLIGFFTNTLVIREKIDPSFTVDELLGNLNQNILDCQKNQDLPFEKIVNELKIERDLSRHPVFQVLFRCHSFVNKPKDEERNQYLALQNVSTTYTSKFDLHLLMEDSGDHLTGVVEYATSLFGTETIERLSKYYTRVLQQLVANSSKAIKDYTLLSKEEYHQIVYQWNHTDKHYPKGKTIDQLFEEQAEKTPDHTALVCEGEELTYQQLNEKSNQLARHLRAQYQQKTKRTLDPDTLIALYLDKSLEMIVGIMAVLKAGGAYVPIDPSFPQERIDYLLKDTDTELILTKKQLIAEGETQLPEDKIVGIDLKESLYDKEESGKLPKYSQATDLAYVIYTSGTTGKPKGVMVEHNAFVQFIFNFNDFLSEKTELKQFNLLCLTNYVFDIFGLEYALPLITGHRVTLSSIDQVNEGDFLGNQLIQQTPSSLLHLATNYSDQLSNMVCLVGGEALSPAIADQLTKSFSQVFNVYGPAETVVWSSAFEVEDPKQPYIGKPLFNEHLFVLDQTCAPVSIGAVGELYIGGASLARGYLNREELTKERFIVNPFATAADKEKGYKRLYKTGDLVRWLPDGNLEFFGRNDDQIKIRGYRIELGEIEHALTQVSGVKQSCVLAKERNTKSGNDKYLVGYYLLDMAHVSDNDSTILDNWEHLYNSEYEKTTEETKIQSDFSIWLSYITGQPIPIAEMEQWRDDIVRIIKTLNPTNVLEIGVGSGLLMYPLLEDIKRFVGLDISRSVIDRHQKYLEGKEHDVELFYLRADEIDQLAKDERYDTIIINSVCQYFPSIHYFEEVLEKAIAKLSENGSIFLGDIRNYDLHHNLIIDKLKHEGKAHTPQSVERAALKENELLISPEYFTNLKKKYKQITIDVFKRGDNYVNELSQYRYDVVLSLKAQPAINGHHGIGDNGHSVALGKRKPLYNTPYLNQLSKEDIRNHLTTVLPAYMIPETFVALPSFPLTTNGKLDKRSLPDPDVIDNSKYIKPTTELEILLCQIYAGVLGLPSDQISTHESFFRMGGNSILSIQLRAKLNQLEEFKGISVAKLFKHNSINKLIQSIDKATQTTYKLQKSPTKNDQHEVAIIGVSGAFSGAGSIKELWDLIANQKEGIEFYSKEECKALDIEDTLLEDPNYVRVAGKVRDIELFDPLFWEMSPNEAKQLDPQTRKFVEHCWFALESSGYAQQRKENNIGVFAGSGTNQYYYDHILYGEMAEEINIWEAANSNSKDALTTKAAFLLGLSGPANSINTACSTGLVSVVEACKNLQLGTCNMALAGGVSLSLPDQVGYIYQEGMIVSKDGHCRTFDQEASGTIAGSGVGIVLLKRLEDAIEDNDNILAVIKGFATNNDGDRKTGYTAPSVIGQSECIINAQKMAGIKANQIDYVECHGTGTHLGDPIEVQALREAFEYNQAKRKKQQHKTVLGAIKANIGHTDSAAGTAGLIKVVTMLQKQLIPGQVNYNEPNAELDLGSGHFEILKENRAWPLKKNQQRIAGVSSFGIGGTNAHVIIGDYIQPDKNGKLHQKITSQENQTPRYIVPLSAKSKQSLKRYQDVLIKHLTKEGNKETLNIANLAYTFEQKRAHFNHRMAYCVESIDDLVRQLKQDGAPAEINTENDNKVVFLFPGQGSQYTGIAKALYHKEVFFKTIVDRCIAIANKHLEVDLFEVLYPKGITSAYDINETRWAQISLFIIEYAFARFLEFLEVKADAYLGHSIGEYVAATLSGVFSLEDAIKLVIARGKLMQSMERGSMLAVNAKLLTVLAIVKEHHCEVAVINSSEDIVVSGADKAIEKLQKTLAEQAIAAVKLKTSHAYHSVMMQQAADEFEKLFKDIKLNFPAIDFISNLTGEIAVEEVATANYWCKQLRNTVQFAKGIKTLSKHYNHQITFVEVGPGRSLTSFVRKHKQTNNYRSIQTAQLLPSAKEAKEAAIFQSITCKEDLKAKLWTNGLFTKPNDKKLFANAHLQAGLPSYQFHHKKYWIAKGAGRGSNDQLKLLPKEKWLSAPVWSAVSNLDKRIHQSNVQKALVFIRADQLDEFDFNTLAKDVQLVILDVNKTTLRDIEDGDSYRIHPTNERHFDLLDKQLRAKNVVFDTIIHMTSIDNTSDLDEALSYSFYSLFLVRHQFLNTKGLERLFVLTNGLAQITNEDLICATNGTLVGAIRNINHEFTYLDAKIIDIGFDRKNALSNLVQVINKTAYPKSEDLMAIRFGKLWIEQLEEIEGDLRETTLIENGDTILVTGGLGGIALATAQHISSKHKVKFILVSRKDIYTAKKQTDYTTQKIELVESIKANGSTVHIHNLDLSKPKQVQPFIAEIEAAYGPVRGIIHAAGSPPLALFKYSLLGIKNNLKGKVYGIDNVMNHLNPEYLKFMVSTSSLASIMGDINRIEYCASNSYLDYLAVDQRRFKNTKIISINWPGWSDIGMVREHKLTGKENEKTLRGLEKLMDLNTLTQEEGAGLFYQLINQTSYGQVAVSKLNLDQFKNKLFKQNSAKTVNREITIVEKDYTETEYKAAQIFCDILGVEEISIHDDFFRVGGNSISAIHIANRINKELGYEIKVADVFKFKSVTGILKNRKLKKVSEENVVVKF